MDIKIGLVGDGGTKWSTDNRTPQRREETVLEQSLYNPNQLSAAVVEAIIRHVGDYANLHGDGWLDIEETLTRVFADIVEVEDDGYAGVTRVTTTKGDE